MNLFFKKSFFRNMIAMLILFILGMGILFSSCDRSRVSFYYAEISPSAPTDLLISKTNSTSATLQWTVADDQAYPTPSFAIFVAQGATTNQVALLQGITNQTILNNLISTTTYSAMVRSTNQSGYADSTSVSFTTP